MINVTTLEILSIMQAAISTKHLLASFPTSIGGEKHNLGMRLHYWPLVQTSLDETPHTSIQSMLLEVGCTHVIYTITFV